MQGKSKSYALLIVMFCAFGLIIYGAYSPARRAQKQQIVCVKFKNGVQSQAVEKHMHDFASLKHEIKQIVGYTAGKTILTTANGTDYDVMHYLTFQSNDDIKAFERSAAYRQFVMENQGSWAKTLVVNADIQP